MVPLAAQPVLEITTFGLAQGAVFALLALGLVLIYRTTGVTNFAHWGIGLMGLTGYFLLSSKADAPPGLAAAIAIGVSGLAGWLAYHLVFRRVQRNNQVVLILIALSVGQFMTAVSTIGFGFESTTIVEPWLPVSRIHVGHAVLLSTQVIAAAAAVGIALVFLPWFRYSRTGKALRAVAQNREAALLAGIDDVRYSSIAWGIGSALAALGILLQLPHTAGDQGILTTFDLTPLGTLLVPAFGAALVGGLVSMPMALAGGFIFGLAQNLLILAPAPWSNLRNTIAAAIIVVLLLLRTERLFTTAQEREALEA
jgi:branched-chain amino acid transport system permease protein